MRALETLLTEKGYVDPAALDLLIELYEKKVGPRNGARVVARAWVDPEYRKRLLADGTPAIAEIGYAGRQGEHVVALENTPTTHNMVVCTLCSCYPWPVLGLPPVWYKSAPYRSRAVSDPRGVLRDFGVELPDTTKIRIWDSTAEIRYIVLPMRPAGTEGWSEEKLADLVTRDSMIGTGLPKQPGEPPDGRRAGHGRREGVWPGVAGAGRAGLSRRVGAARVCADAGDGAAGRLEHRHVALCAREPSARRLSEQELLPDLARGPREADDRARPRLARGDRSRQCAHAAQAGSSRAPSADVRRCCAAGRPSAIPSAPARFAIGDNVRMKNINPPTHTRLPRYVRGRVGTIELLHGAMCFPTQLAGPGRGPAMALHRVL